MNVEAARKLYDASRWNDLAQAPPCSSTESADIYYYRGMALAHLEQWDKASQALKTGQKKFPQDERFPIELAGIAFKQKKFSDAERNLHRALRLDPHNHYVLNFLATLYYLDGNLEAALKYWNRTGKPRIAAIQTPPAVNVDPELLDHAFTCAPSSVLKLEDYLTSRQRLDQLGIFHAYRLDLFPESAAPETFNLKLSGVARSSWGGAHLETLLPILRGVPYQTVYLQFYNLRKSAFNIDSLIRWDDQKRRIYASVSAPLENNPKFRYRFYIDARNENWNVSQTYKAPGSPLEAFNLEKIEAGAGIKSIVNSGWSWSAGLDVSGRRFRNLPPKFSNPVFTKGIAAESWVRGDFTLLRIPEKRFTVSSAASASLGKFYARDFDYFSQLQGIARARWFPERRGDDYETSEDIYIGKTVGRVPFDKFYMLGLERDDNDLPLRAHIVTESGQKGAAPLGRDYVLSNWETDKNVYEGGWFRLRLAPFIDTGKIYDRSDGLGSHQWLWDTGGSVKLGLLGGVTVVFTYGKDLRTGKNAFYITTSKGYPSRFGPQP